MNRYIFFTLVMSSIPIYVWDNNIFQELKFVVRSFFQTYHLQLEVIDIQVNCYNREIMLCSNANIQNYNSEVRFDISGYISGDFSNLTKIYGKQINFLSASVSLISYTLGYNNVNICSNMPTDYIASNSTNINQNMNLEDIQNTSIEDINKKANEKEETIINSDIRKICILPN